MAVTVSNTSASLSGKTLLKSEDAQTITGLKTFNLGVSAPFAVIAGASVVANLDADKLDGQHGAFYQDASNLNAGTVPIARVVGADPNADRGVFWDESANALAFLELVGLAIRGTQLQLHRGVPCGRLTLTSGTPVTDADVTAAVMLYYALYAGNQVPLFNGTEWENFEIAELSIAVPNAADTAYDVFLDINAGVPQLALTAWTNLTTRATALTRQDGYLVKTGATGQLYLGSFRTTSVAGQTEDSETKRYLYNHFHQENRRLYKTDTTASWTYTNLTIRQARATAANKVEVFNGYDAVLDLGLTAIAVNDTGNSFASGIGEDSTSTFMAGGAVVSRGSITHTRTVRVTKKLALGHHSYSWNEQSEASGTTTWYGQNSLGTSNYNSGLQGVMRG